MARRTNRYRKGEKSTDVRVGILNGEPALITNWGGRIKGVPLSLDGAGNAQAETSFGKLKILSDGTVKVADIMLSGKMKITSTGTDNVSIGVNNTDFGEENISIGVDAGAAIPVAGSYTGKSCVFIGKGAGLLATGSWNTCIGHEAGAGITTGTSNIVLGSSSGSGLTDGIDNICIGIIARVKSDASSNIAIGNATRALGAEGDIAIGRAAWAYGTASATSSIAIGNAAQAITVGGSAVDNAISIGRSTRCSVADTITIGSAITNSTTRTVKFGDAGASMISLDWDTSGDSTWVRSSDRRKKRNIKDNTLGLEFINKLQTRTFQMKSQNELPKEWVNYSETNRYDTEKVHIGFIAQELKALIDEYDAPNEVASWSEDPDGMQRAGETKLITPLIKAVQELSAKLDNMDERLTNLEGV